MGVGVVVGVDVGVLVGVAMGANVLVGVTVGGGGADQKYKTPTSPPNTRSRADRRTTISLDRSGATGAAGPASEGIEGG